MINLKSLIKDSRTFFPTSKNMQRQWVRKTMYLLQEGKHSKLTGGWFVPGSQTNNANQ